MISSRQLLILLVEDDDDSREMMTLLLRAAGDHRITGVATAEEGLDALRGEPSFDLLFTDVGLPGMSGLELLDLALSERLIQPSHIVVCSAYGGIRDRVLSRGARAIPKPVDEREVLSLIRGLR